MFLQSDINYLPCEINKLSSNTIVMQERLDAIERKSMVAYGTILLKACLQKYHAMHKTTKILGPQLYDAQPDDSWFSQLHFNTDDADVGSQNLVQTAEGLDKGRFLRDTGLSMECFTLLKQYPKVSLSLR